MKVIRFFFTTKLSLFEFFTISTLCSIHILLFLYFTIPKATEYRLDGLNTSNCRSCQYNYRENVVYSSRDDYIFTYDYENNSEYEIILRSARSSGFIGKIVIFTKNMNHLDKDDCDVQYFSTKTEKRISNSFKKYFDLYSYLSLAQHDIYRLLLVDPKKVFLMKDPFKIFHNPNRVYSFKQSKTFLPREPSVCKDLWNSKWPVYYDNHFIAGGSLQVKRFLRLLTLNSTLKSCFSSDEDHVVLSYYGNVRFFGNENIHYIAVATDNPDIGFKGKSLQFGSIPENSTPNISTYPSLLINYKEIPGFSDFLKKNCI